MNELQIFNFNNQDVRIIDRDGGPWWVAKDICAILNVSDAMSRLDGDEKLYRSDLLSLGQRGGYVINGPGLYSIILRSEFYESQICGR